MPKKAYSFFDSFDDDNAPELIPGLDSQEGPTTLSPDELMSAFVRQDSMKRKNDNRTKTFQKAFRNVIIDKPVTPEELAARQVLFDDYVGMHPIIFPESTGLKPYGQEQQAAIRRFQKIVQGKGKLVQAEPRSFAKTSRAVNQTLMGVLEGKIKFGLIVSSATEKAEEIMEQIQTELLTNDALLDYFPNVMKCFRLCEGKAHVAPRISVNDEPAYMKWGVDIIQFPIIDGEPSSGAILMVRTKENLRGLSKKIRYGAEKGQLRRPDFVLFDDIQTDKDAMSPTVCKKIVDTIKRSAMFGGSHSKKIRAVMTITPNREGDVASHFILKEPSWEVAMYSMLQVMPTNMEMWDQFGRILLNFDKRKEGDRERAERRALAFVQENYDELHRGAVASWEWAYDWESEDSTEVSAVHHAMVFFYEEGEEAFNYECQCIIKETKIEDEPIKCPADVLESRISHLSRKIVPRDANIVVSHIDVNMDVLTYATYASGPNIMPFCIDYGTYPEQPGATWKKSNIVVKLSSLYPEINKEDVGNLMYQAVKDLTTALARNIYVREDKHELLHRWIGVDSKWLTADILRAIRESTFRSLLVATQGVFFGEKDVPLMETTNKTDRELHLHCYTTPSSDRTVDTLRIDTNNIKTLVHRGFMSKPGTLGSIRLFIPNVAGGHRLFVTHCMSENVVQKINKKLSFVVNEWSHDTADDNEFFDNTVGCYALLLKSGCNFKKDKVFKRMDMQEYMNSQSIEP